MRIIDPFDDAKVHFTQLLTVGSCLLKIKNNKRLHFKSLDNR